MSSALGYGNVTGRFSVWRFWMKQYMYILLPGWGRSPPGGGRKFYRIVIGGLAIAMAARAGRPGRSREDVGCARLLFA